MIKHSYHITQFYSAKISKDKEILISDLEFALYGNKYAEIHAI